MIITTNTIDITEQLVQLIGCFNSTCDRAVCLSNRLDQSLKDDPQAETSVLCADLYFKPCELATKHLRGRNAL